MNNINLSELTLENVGQWPLPVKIGMVSTMALLIIGLGYWLMVKPNFEQYEQLKREEQTLKAEFERKHNLAANLNQYRNQLKLMEERFGNMLRRLPAKQEMPGLVEDISKTGIASGLKFELFAPQEEIEHDFYIELPIKIKVVGNYHQIAVFLSRVAQMGRIVTMHDFVLEAAKTKDEKVAASGDQLVLDMTAKIYRYRTQ